MRTSELAHCCCCCSCCWCWCCSLVLVLVVADDGEGVGGRGRRVDVTWSLLDGAAAVVFTVTTQTDRQTQACSPVTVDWLNVQLTRCSEHTTQHIQALSITHTPVFIAPSTSHTHCLTYYVHSHCSVLVIAHFN